MVYYLHPSDDELRKLAGIPIPKPKPKPKEGETHRRGKNRRKWEEPEEDKTFTVPRSLDVQVFPTNTNYWTSIKIYLFSQFQLETARIMPVDILQLKFFSEFIWLIDYSVFAMIVYTITEVLYITQRVISILSIFC